MDVRDLFGLHSHSVNLRTEDRVTILHGPNGIGKTILLKMISAFFAGDYFVYEKIPFTDLKLTVVDVDQMAEGLISVARSESEGVLTVNIKSTVKSMSGEIAHRLPSPYGAHARQNLPTYIPYITPKDDGRWIDHRLNRIITTEQVWQIYSHMLPAEIAKQGIFDDPPWLRDLRETISVHFIETQRLLRQRSEMRSEDDGLAHTVNACARDLASQITRTIQRYGREAQALDQSFPRRLLHGVDPLPIDAIQQRMAALDEKQLQMRSIGILQEASGPPVDPKSLRVERIHQEVMTLYLTDTERKLEVFSQLQQRITLFLENLNKKFKNKKLSADLEQGLVLKGHNGKPLQLSALSSGEQHELVLLYDLLFAVRTNGLVLIDEPELSLHVEWQQDFLSDLLAVVSLAHFDVIIATHSPFITGDRTDLMESLKENSRS